MHQSSSFPGLAKLRIPCGFREADFHTCVEGSNCVAVETQGFDADEMETPTVITPIKPITSSKPCKTLQTQRRSTKQQDPMKSSATDQPSVVVDCVGVLEQWDSSRVSCGA